MLIKVKGMKDLFYTPKDVAKMLKVSYMSVYRWIRAGKLKAYQIQKQYRIKDVDYKLFIEQNKKERR